MGILNFIRPRESKKKQNISLMLTGLGFLLIGLFNLFLLPYNLRGSTMMFGSFGKAPIPNLVFTLIGWVFFSFGLLNLFSWTSKENHYLLKRVIIFGIKDLKIKAFTILSAIFFTIVIIAFSVLNPFEKLKTQKEESNKIMNEINKSLENLK